MIMHILSIISGYAVWTVIFLGGSAVVRSAMSDVHDAEGTDYGKHSIIRVSSLKCFRICCSRVYVGTHFKNPSETGRLDTRCCSFSNRNSGSVGSMGCYTGLV